MVKPLVIVVLQISLFTLLSIFHRMMEIYEISKKTASRGGEILLSGRHYDASPELVEGNASDKC